jgi:transcriptional regulator with XRE-family HTH domain
LVIAKVEMIKESDKIALKKFGDNLRKLRKNKSLTLRELSSACNIDYSNILRIEQGKINPTLTTILELASALELNPLVLLDYNYL